MKEKIANLLNKRVTKVIIVVLVAFIIINIAEIIISSKTASRNEEWGVKVDTSNVSSTGLTMTVQRFYSEKNISKRMVELTLGDSYWIEKRTLVGWEKLEFIEGGSIPSLSWVLPLDSGNPRMLNHNWERAYGELEPGVYRIGINVFIEAEKNTEMEKENEQKFVLYKTFGILF